MRFRDDFAQILRSCLDEAEDWHSVEACFRNRIDQDDQEQADDARPIVFAFGYMLVGRRREEIRERAGVFGTQIEMQGVVFPARLEDIEEDMLSIWAAYAEETKEYPLASSRLNDLLWVRRYGELPIDHARSAVDGYLALAESSAGMELVDSLQRALEIAFELEDQGRLEAAFSKALEVARSEIRNASERRPGIPLNLLEAVVDLGGAQSASALHKLLDAASERYGEDPYIAESVSELKQKLSAPDEREELQRRQVARWREEAKKGDAILRHSRLQQALGLARSYGFTESAEEILLEMQEISSDDFDLKRITAEVEYPREEIEALLKQYAASESWQEALRRFGAEGPPSGDVKDNAKLTKELAEKYPIQRLFAAQILGPHGSITVAAGSEEEHDRVDLARHEAMQISIWAPIGVQILGAIKNAFGTPSRAELDDFFTTELIDREVAARIADGVLRFFNGDDDGSVHILAPQLEAAIRGAAARAGVVVIRTPRGGTPGGVRALGGILADLEGRLDESWRRYLANSLTDPLGINLRNQLSHGLHGPTGRGDVAVAIQVACHLRLWRRGAEEANAENESPETGR